MESYNIHTLHWGNNKAVERNRDIVLLKDCHHYKLAAIRKKKVIKFTVLNIGTRINNYRGFPIQLIPGIWSWHFFEKFSNNCKA